MHDPISYALQRVRLQVNKTLLDLAFQTNPYYDSYQHASQEAKIRHEIIEQWVLPDLDIVGGDTIVIPLDQITPIEFNNAWVYQVPLSLTKGRHITRINSVETSVADTGPNQTLLDAVYNASHTVQSTGTARIEIVGPNTLACHERIVALNTFIRATIANDQNLANLPMPYHRKFARLVILATQGYIHTKLAGTLVDNARTGGPVSGNLQSILDGYADAIDMYNELLDTQFTRIFQNKDKNHKRRNIRAQLGLG